MTTLHLTPNLINANQVIWTAQSSRPFSRSHSVVGLTAHSPFGGGNHNPMSPHTTVPHSPHHTTIKIKPSTALPYSSTLFPIKHSFSFTPNFSTLLFKNLCHTKSSQTPLVLTLPPPPQTLCLSQSMGSLSACFLFSFLLLTFTEAGTIGVNYGRVANNLPPAANVVELLKSQGITQVKLYDTDSSVLKSFANSGIKITVALPNELLASVAARPNFAYYWVQRNVASFYPATQIQAIAVGNEVFVNPKNLTSYLLPAMTNVHAALVKLNLDKAVKVSSPIALTALQSSYPPSAGLFRSDLSVTVMKPMLELLRQTGSYLMVNAYPFFAYEANADVISLDYALFRPNAGVLDPGSGLKYYSLFDAQVDAVAAAMSTLKYDDVRIVVSETGWPSKGDANENGAGAANAATYNGNLIRRVLSGNCATPRRPQGDMDVFLFGLFNENQKPGPTSERNYGLFYPNEQKVYDVSFVLGNSNNGKGNMSWQDDGSRGNNNSKGGNSSSGNGNNNNNNNGGVRASSTGETWCVANGMVGKEKLQVALDYACGEGGADCKPIQPGADCFDPNTIEAHASYAFNSYYQKKGKGIGTCDFQGSAYVVSQAPKIGKCVFPSGY